jgi:hypothetical protein
MHRVIAELRRMSKELRTKKAAIILELRNKRQEKKSIDQELIRLRKEIKSIKGDHRDY